VAFAETYKLVKSEIIHIFIYIYLLKPINWLKMKTWMIISAKLVKITFLLNYLKVFNYERKISGIPYLI